MTGPDRHDMPGAARIGPAAATFEARLTPVQACTRLDYDVSARIGSRPVDAAARRIADDPFAVAIAMANDLLARWRAARRSRWTAST
ncbi:MAG: hypothetical protein WCK28_01345 [Burkholderiales bacterium]